MDLFTLPTLDGSIGKLARRTLQNHLEPLNPVNTVRVGDDL